MSQKQTQADFVKAVLKRRGRSHQDDIIKEYLTAKENNEISESWTVDSVLRTVRRLAEGKEIHRYGDGTYRAKLEKTKDQTELTTFIGAEKK